MEPVTISIRDTVVHTMRSGVGASWHSIIVPTVSHGGSAFGASPPVVPEHEALWQSMESHAEWLALKFIRAEMDWRQWQPQPGQFTWGSPEMEVLDRILRWAQRHGSDVLLQSMWANVAWLAFPEYRNDPALTQVSAPADLDAFAAGWVRLLQELIGGRGYTCIRWIGLVNEPNYYWWLIPPDRGESQDRNRQTRYLAAALRKVRDAVRAAQLPVRVLGPGFTDLPVIAALVDEPWWTCVDDVDFHSYGACFDWEDPAGFLPAAAYRLGDRLSQTLAQYRRETAAAGKGLLLTEFGTQIYGCQADDPAPGSFKASLKDTELLIRALNFGLDGLNHWSFANRGDLDGQWQYVDTWNRRWKHWLPTASPHGPAYFVLGLATRHLPHRAEILATDVRGGTVNGVSRVWAAAVRSPADKSLTVLVVNDADQPWEMDLCLPRPASTLVTMGIWPDAPAEEALRYRTLAMQGGSARITLPAFSLMIATDTPLTPDGPGRW